MNVAEFIVDYLKKQNIDTYFIVSGGGCIWLIDAICKNKDVTYICHHHEQAAAMAAEGYARITGKIGVVVVTSGPGGTNALTGVLGAYLDSIPMLILSGNVNTSLIPYRNNNVISSSLWSNTPNIRQLGDQEFDIISTVKPLTIESKLITKNHIKYLEKDLDYTIKIMSASNRRSGPVWLDIPLDVQSHSMIKDNTTDYSSFANHSPSISPSIINSIYNDFKNASRPLLIIGNGIRLGNAIDELKEFLTRTNIPVISAVNGNDIINETIYPYYCGRHGTHGQIAANKIIDKSDFILTLGTRNYIRQTGYAKFGKNAKIYYVELDPHELNVAKSPLENSIGIIADVKEFLKYLNTLVFLEHKLDWSNFCKNLYENTPTVLDRHRNLTQYVSNYYLIEVLNKYLKETQHIVTSDGGANVVTMQVIKLKGNQRLFTNTGCAAMGYGLPAAIGASVGLRGKDELILIEGDGSFHLNIHELQTIKHHNLPIKILLLNNNGYNSIKITQKSMMKGRIAASTPETGVSFPNFEKIIKAYGLPYMSIKNHKDIDHYVRYFLNQIGPLICEVFLDPEELHEPKVSAKVLDDGTIIPGSLEDIDWIIK